MDKGSKVAWIWYIALGSMFAGLILLATVPINKVDQEGEAKLVEELKTIPINKADEEREAELVEELKAIPVAQFGENLARYRELLNLKPDDERYQKKVRFYSEKIIETKRKKSAAEKAEPTKKQRQPPRATEFSQSINSRDEVINLVKAQSTVVDAKWGQDISLWIWMPDEGRNYESIAALFCRTVVRPRKLGTIYIHIWRQGTMDRLGKHKCRA
jgi:hypothetical protein